MKRKLGLIVSIFCIIQSIIANEEDAVSTPLLARDAQVLNLGNSRIKLADRVNQNADVLALYDVLVSEWLAYDLKDEKKLDLFAMSKAIDFAAIKHEGQYREGILRTPYIIHPLGVVKSLWSEGGIREGDTLVAAVLHDTLEDTQTTPEEIEANFGYHVRSIVEELTDDPHLSSEEKKQKQVEHAKEYSREARLIKLADRLYNIRDLKNLTPSERLACKNYLEWSLKLLTALRGANMVLENALELEILTQLTEDQ
ncbi:MAG: bifunctional (p)ppGpp synthetase/guanosine-3',5'-bis(diphosphate) 3'-pyrophosphohydrolase [Verrucomicrobia bacterium]|nr:bifunctional (p)ppGpp synthetase/guanosine-3',5'-bis(diphosphate) 3'-pyrophosphohydrolase [Verrucomicrobiota bacterium]